MNTQLAFTFGMLAVVSIGMIIGTIVGLVKVYRLEAKVKEINRDIHGSIERVWQHLNQVETNLNRRVDETERNVAIELDDIRRNMDSRFDKFENKLKTMVLDASIIPVTQKSEIEAIIEKTKGKKQLLKD